MLRTSLARLPTGSLIALLTLNLSVPTCSRWGAPEENVPVARTSSALTQGSAAGPPPAPPEPNWQTVLSDKLQPTEMAGTLAGSGSVSADGAYTYRLPIRVPAGRLDMTPNIELTYSSRAGNGPLGLGWSISAISSITRCRKTLAHEEAAWGVLFNPTDRFCLDGQKLESISGVYGANGAEYRTERFSGSKIVSNGGGLNPGEPGSFEVRTASGRILRYGGSRFSAIYRPVWGDPITRGNAIFGWLLDTDLDRFGNAIHYDYSVLGTGEPATHNAQRKLTGIRYTANDGAGLAATRLIRFVYESRPDRVTQSVSGMQLTWTQRLSQIEVLGPRVPDGEPEVLWTYALTYEQTPHAGLSRISSIQWCDSDGGCLPPTRFKWGPSHGFAEGPAEPKYEEVWRAPQRVNLKWVDWTKLHLVDLNGDGRDDLVYNPAHPREVSEERRPDPSCTPDEIAHDRCDRDPVLEEHSNLKARLSTGQGFGDELSIDRFDNYVENNPDGGFDQYRSRFADFDGDGRMELLAWANHDQATTWDPNSLGWRIYRFINGGLFRVSPLHIPAWTGEKPNVFKDEIQVVDADGDGLPDILVDRATGPNAAAATFIHNKGLGSFAPEVSMPDCHLNGSWSFPSDIDGDGRTDIVNLSHNEFDPDDWPTSFGVAPFVDPPPNYILPNGFPFSIDASKYRLHRFVAGRNGVTIPYWSTRTLADVTGDGLDDLVTVENAGVKVYSNIGRGLTPGLPWFGRLSDKLDGLTPPDRTAGGVIPADFNGDGLTDLLILESADAKPHPFQAFVMFDQPPTLLLSDGSSFRQVEAFSAPQAGLRVRPWGPTRRGPHWGGAAVGDMDGDGVPEIAQFEKRHVPGNVDWMDLEYDLVVYSQRPTSQPAMGLVAETITEVSNGMGLVERVLYRPLTDPATYTPGSGCDVPQRCLTRGLWVVKLHRVSNATNPNEPDRDFSFKYEDARTDVRGRGFLGFKCVTSVDVARAREIKTCYRQHQAIDIPVKKACPGYAYPYASLPSSVTVKQTIEANLFRFAQTDYKYDNPPVWGPGHTFRVHLRDLEERVAEGPEGVSLLLGSPAIQQVRRVSYTFDSNGNLREQYSRVHERNESSPQFEERRFNQWIGADTAQWLISRLQFSDVQVTRRNEQMRKRVTDYEYVPNTPGVSKVIVRRADDTQDVELSTVYGRDPSSGCIKTATRTDGFGNVRVDKVDYDADKVFPRRLENGLGHVTWVGHHPSTGDLLFMRDPNRADQRWQYDWAGRLRVYNSPDGAVAERRYGKVDELAAEIGANVPNGPLAVLATGRPGPDMLTTIDAWGRATANVWRATDGTLSKMTTTYDVLGRPTFKSLTHTDGESPSGTYQFGYDFLDRPRRLKNPDGTEKVWSYPSFFEATMTDEGPGSEGPATLRMVHDVLGNVKQVFADPSGANIRTDLSYDSLGNLSKVVRNAGSNDAITIDRSCDTLGRVTRYADPDRGTFRYRYNGYGNLREQTHEGVSGTVIASDALGRVTSTTASIVSGGTEIQEFAYDQSGHGAQPAQRGTGEVGALTSTLSSDGVATNHYFDALGRSVRNCWTIQGTEDCLQQSYHAPFTTVAGSLATMAYPDRPWKAGETQPLRIAMRYDASDSSLAIVENISTGHAYWEATARSPEGLVTAAKLGGTDVLSQFDEVTRRLEDLTVKSGATERMHLKYTYHPNGNIQTREDVTNGFTDTFDYDRLSRLTRWSAAGNRQVTERYDYDRLGNLMGTRNAQNQVVDDYDLGRTDNAGPQGVTRLAEGATGDVFTFKYDLAKRQADRLRNGQPWQWITYAPFNLPRRIVTRVNGSDVPTTFLYDAFHARVRKSNPGESTTYIAGLYERRVRQVLGGSTTTSHVYYVPGESGMVAQVEFDEGSQSHRTLQLHSDPLGSNTVLTDGAGGAVEQLYYSPFGRRINRSGAVVTAPPGSVRLGFTGHEHDDELSLINMRGRMYDPRLRRFTTPDPVVREHPYAYVNNNPLRYVDPLGLYGEDNRARTGSGGDYTDYAYIFASQGGHTTSSGTTVIQEGDSIVVLGTHGSGSGSGTGTGSPDDRARTSVGPQPGGPTGPTGITVTVGPALPPYGPNTGGFDPSQGSYSGGSATGAGSHAPNLGKGPPASAQSEHAQAQGGSPALAEKSFAEGQPKVQYAERSCPTASCYDNTWVEGQKQLYRDQTGADDIAFWPFTLFSRHKDGAAWDYWGSNYPKKDASFELRPDQWVDPGDFGNYMAGYGAAVTAPLPAAPIAEEAMEIAGGHYNKEADRSGAYGDSASSTYFIRLGYDEALGEEFEAWYPKGP
jgi:RHS repeat-associated protein